MRLGIMQPYLFPYLGYFDLIHCTDRWIVFDTVQYIRHGWVNRNRIRQPGKEWQYITVPLSKHSRNATIREIRTAQDQPWRERIMAQLQHYRKRAPYFTPVMELVRESFTDESGSLARLNVRALELTCRYLGIPFAYAYFSEMDLDPGPITGPGDWALRIAESLGADEYVNPPGGASLFDRARFEGLGIRLTIRDMVEFEYPTPGYPFVPNLSIIDVLMWNDPARVRGYLDGRNNAGGTEPLPGQGAAERTEEP